MNFLVKGYLNHNIPRQKILDSLSTFSIPNLEYCFLRNNNLENPVLKMKSLYLVF